MQSDTLDGIVYVIYTALSIMVVVMFTLLGYLFYLVGYLFYLVGYLFDPQVDQHYKVVSHEFDVF